MKKKVDWRLFLSDAISNNVASLLVCFVIEKLILDLTWDQFITVRLMAIVPNTVSGPILGVWIDYVRSKMGTGYLSDTVASLSFSLLLYTTILTFGGCTVDQIIPGLAMVGGVSLVSGRIYGKFQDYMRTKIAKKH